MKQMAEPDACCGSGGSFLLTQYGASKEIAQRQVIDFNKTDAERVVTGCPAYMMQLLDHVGRFAQGQKINHCIFLLGESCGRERKGVKVNG